MKRIPDKRSEVEEAKSRQARVELELLRGIRIRMEVLFSTKVMQECLEEIFKSIQAAVERSLPIPSDKMLEMAEEGEKLEAIKLYRDTHDCRLTEAKAVINSFDSGYTSEG